MLHHPFKVQYHANENPLQNSETIAYVDQKLMYPIIKLQHLNQLYMTVNCLVWFIFFHLELV